MSFVHLHNHTQYSMLDGACKIDKMIDMAKKNKMPAVAITDHGNIFGIVKFYQTAKRKGIKPILGMEAYVVEHDFSHPQTKADKRYHLVLLVKNEAGYKNLMRIASESYINGFYYKPRINKEFLRTHSEGLIALSGCIVGEIPFKLLNKGKEEAQEALEFYKGLFKEDFYIELQDHGIKNEKKVMPLLINLAHENKVQMVVTNDCHYLYKENAPSHEVLLCIQTSTTLDDENRFAMNTDQLYFKTPQEMSTLFPKIPQAMENTLIIANKIDFDLESFYDNYLLPTFTVPKEYNSSTDYIASLIKKSKSDHYKIVTPQIEQRIEYELETIKKMGYEGYFLIVKDLIDYAKKMGIPVGPGRGSAAGSIISYLLGITQVDPIKYGLLFERFLNPERVGMPDIDIDFCTKGRGQIIEYIVEKYGRECVSQIVTFGSLAAKVALKDVARVMGVSASQANELTKTITKVVDVKLEQEYKTNSEFRDLIDSKKLYSDIFQHSLFMEGLIRQTGVHACGVLISPYDMREIVPLSLSKAKKGEKPAVLCQYEGNLLDDLKLLKMDILGLKNLTLIKDTVDLIQESIGRKIDINTIPLNDKKTYKIFGDGLTDGVFQFESDGMKKYLSQLKPNCFEDLIAMVSLYRPGPMQYIDSYIKRKHKKENIRYIHPLMEKVLKETYGITLYQEQVMNLSKTLGDFSGGQADTLRKAMGKKKKKLMDKLYDKFEKGAISKGITKEQIHQIWSEWEQFASYAFNKSHAACYALIAYQTAYLKAHYLVEFMATLLSLEGNPIKIPLFLEKCRDLGIEVIAPDILICKSDFLVKDKKIVFGLNGIKNVGQAAISSIERARANTTFGDIFDFACNVNLMAVNKATFEALICSGAMDCLPGSRAAKFEAIEQIIEYGADCQRRVNSDQLSIFDAIGQENSKKLYKPKLSENLKWKYLETLKYEKKVLGFYISGHPLSEYKILIENFSNIDSVNFAKKIRMGMKQVKIAGVVTKIAKKISKKGQPFAIISMEDLKGKFEITLFGGDYTKYISQIEENERLFIDGKTSFFENQKEGALLRIIPQRVVKAQDLKKDISGDIRIKLPCGDITCKTAEKVKKIFAGSQGSFRVSFVVKSQEFGDLRFYSGSISTFPSQKILKKLEKKYSYSVNFKDF